MKSYYVYVYYDPRINPATPIYVGKGHGDRYQHHIKKGAKNKHLFNKLNKIKECSMEPLIEFTEKNLSEKDAIVLEIELISKFGRADKKLGTLCNWTDGGEGTSGYKHSEETKRLFSEQRKGKKQTQKQYEANCSRKVSEETKKKISKATKGHKWTTVQQREAIREHNKTRKITEEMRCKWSKTRLGHTPTKANYPPIEKLIAMIESSSKNKVAKQLGINPSCLYKYLKRRNIQTRDMRFSDLKLQ